MKKDNFTYLCNISYNNAVVCFERDYPKELWICLVSDKSIADKIWDNAKAFVSKRKALNREPLLFN